MCLTFQELDRLELQEMIEEEGLGVGQGGRDAALSLLAGLAGVLGRVGPQQHDHDVGGLVTVKTRKKKLTFN